MTGEQEATDEHLRDITGGKTPEGASTGGKLRKGSLINRKSFMTAKILYADRYHALHMELTHKRTQVGVDYGRGQNPTLEIWPESGGTRVSGYIWDQQA